MRVWAMHDISDQRCVLHTRTSNRCDRCQEIFLPYSHQETLRAIYNADSITLKTTNHGDRASHGRASEGLTQTEKVDGAEQGPVSPPHANRAFHIVKYYGILRSFETIATRHAIDMINLSRKQVELCFKDRNTLQKSSSTPSSHEDLCSFESDSFNKCCVSISTYIPKMR